jgi:hypothetical protein
MQNIYVFIKQYFNFILVDNEVKSLCGNNFMETIFKFLHSIMFTLTLQISKLANVVFMANIHTMDQYLSPLRYFLIITIVKLQYNAQ